MTMLLLALVVAVLMARFVWMRMFVIVFAFFRHFSYFLFVVLFLLLPAALLFQIIQTSQFQSFSPRKTHLERLEQLEP